MNVRRQVFGEDGVDRALAFKASLARENVRDNLHPKMTLAFWPSPSVTRVHVGFVNDFKAYWCQGLAQFFFYGGGNTHDDSTRFGGG